MHINWLERTVHNNENLKVEFETKIEIETAQENNETRNIESK